MKVEHSEEWTIPTAAPQWVDDQLPTTPQEGEEDSHVVRLKQQLHGRTKQAEEAEERARQAQQRADNLKQQSIARERRKLFAQWDDFDSKYFSELYKDDPELADDLAKTLTINGRPAKNAEEILSYFGENVATVTPSHSEPVSADTIRNILEELLEERETKKTVTTYFDALQGEEKELAQQKFKRLTEWRKISKDEAQEIADMVITHVRKDKREISITPWAITTGGITPQVAKTGKQVDAKEFPAQLQGYL